MGYFVGQFDRLIHVVNFLQLLAARDFAVSPSEFDRISDKLISFRPTSKLACNDIKTIRR